MAKRGEISYNERTVSITPGSGGILALDMEQGEQYKKPFMLNECGAYIYRAYISGMSEDEIMQAFAKEYGLSFSCAQSDVGQFMMELRQQGII